MDQYNSSIRIGDINVTRFSLTGNVTLVPPSPPPGTPPNWDRADVLEVGVGVTVPVSSGLVDLHGESHRPPAYSPRAYIFNSRSV